MTPTAYKGTGTKKNTMRKPAVEKMRRDRINKCIEELKVLLKKEMNGQQPCSKLEKADVLEMAVVHLKKSMRMNHRADAQSFSDGFSRCIQETVRFLSVQNHLQISTFMGHKTGTVPPKSNSKVRCVPEDSCQDVFKQAGDGELWRPW